jgi:hypothetical protein
VNLKNRIYVEIDLHLYLTIPSETEHRSQYGDWLRAGRPRGRSSSRDPVKISLLSTPSVSVLGSF